MAVGVVLSMYYWWKMGRDEHLEEISLFDTYFLALLSYYVFGRVGYTLANWGELGELGKALAVLAHPGLHELVGLTGAILVVAGIAKAKDWEFWKIMDMAAVSVALLSIFVTMGGLVNGQVVWWMGVAMTVYSMLSFVMTLRVRKNFRFYAWYKGEASVAREGLASLLALALLGLWLAGSAWYPSLAGWQLSGGLVMMVSAGWLILQRSGRKVGMLIKRKGR